ncbi:MAG: hypothetical protein GU356_00525 [Pyrobaculum sp.]|jgi:hypothetical protein|nr:hypothetical protein [Pyrobaculum sp.]
MHPLRYQAPEDGKVYVLVLGRDLEWAPWLSVYGFGKQQIPATTFVKYILQSAEKEYNAVYRKALDIVKVERTRGPLRLECFEKNIASRFIRVISRGAEFVRGGGSKMLQRIKRWQTSTP